MQRAAARAAWRHTRQHRLHPTLKSISALFAVFISVPVLAAGIDLDSVSVEVGGGRSVQKIRFGVQHDMNKRYFDSNGTHIGAYWDFSISQWRGNAYHNVQGQRQNLTVIGATPTFRFQRNDGTGFFGEIGIGYHLFSELYDNSDNRLSTAFQFGDHLGVGYAFPNRVEACFKLQHYSNASIKRLNSGANFLMFKVAAPF